MDGLTLVNDTLGQQAGDDHIKLLGEALAHTMGPGRGVYRTGGDEASISAVSWFLCAHASAAQMNAAPSRSASMA